jgi:hypothetical protein
MLVTRRNLVLPSFRGPRVSVGFRVYGDVFDLRSVFGRIWTYRTIR